MKRTEQQIIADLREVECNLSPENLNWDGERCPKDAQRAYNVLTLQRKQLVKELGREPTFEELWNF